uniref:Xpo1 domain-containing protein n=3 Tax=Mesocestoides corti TaxID=53468 RepID=A0A5K3EH25_MESCO
MSLAEVVDSLKKIFSLQTLNAERVSCYKFTENYKESLFKLDDLKFLCSSDQEPPIVLYGLSCLEHRVKRKWAILSAAERQEVRQYLCYFVTDLENMSCRNTEGNAVCLYITQIMVHLIKCEWPQEWPSMIPELINLGKAGSLQSLIVFDIFRRLSEDLLFFQDVPINRRRELCVALSDNVSQIIHFALDFIFLTVDSRASLVTGFDVDVTRSLKSGLLLLSALLEWCNITSFFEWKAPKEAPTTSETVPSIQLLLYVVLYPKLRTEAAEVLSVILAKKQNNVLGCKSVEMKPTYIYFVAFNSNTRQNPAAVILDITRSVFTNVQYDEELCLFLRRWSEVVSLLGMQVVEHWSQLEGRGQIALEVIDLIIQANVYVANHPFKLLSVSVSCFFKSILSSNHFTLVSLLSKYMSRLLQTWMEVMVLQPYPNSTDPMASWIYANCEKDEYAESLTKTRSTLKSHCILYAASIWPTEVIKYLIGWHKRLLKEVAQEEDFIYPSQPFIKPTSLLARLWEALAFAMDKTLTSVFTGEVMGSKVPLADASHDPNRGHGILVSHLSKCVADGTLVDLPADPGVRQNYLGVLHSLIINCLDTQGEFALKLLMQDFATLRYNPCVVTSQATNTLGPLRKYINLRCQSVKNMHISVGVNVFRLVRAQPSALLPFFESFCSELNDIWSNRHGGLGEQCLLLEVVIYLALRLPCSLVQQREKLESILESVFADWKKLDSVLLSFASPERGCENLLEYFGLTQDVDELKAKPDLLVERIPTRLRLRWISAATLSAVRRLNAPLSSEQTERVCVPLAEDLIFPCFCLLRTLNKLWQPATAERCHPSMRAALEVTAGDKALLTRTALKKPAKTGDPKKMVTVEYSVLDSYLPELQSFLSHINVSTIQTCQLLVEVTANLFYSLPTEQLNQLLFNCVCPDIASMPDYRLLQILRYFMIPFVRSCPAANIESALIPLMPYVLDALYQKVNKSWSVVESIDKEEVGEEEATEEIFVEETVRSLSASLVELTRLLLVFTGARQRGKVDSSQEEIDVDVEVQDQMDVAEAAQPIVSESSIVFGPFGKALLAVDSADGAIPVDGMFARMASWLTAAANWPDSKVCTKAAILLVKVIDFTLRRDTPHAHLLLPPEVACQLLIGGLYALRANGQYLSEFGPPLFNVISRAIALIAGGLDAVTAHLEPILFSALNSCQNNTAASKHLANIKKYTLQVFDPNRPPSKKIREQLKNLLQPLIGVAVAEQYKQELSISTLEPLKRPSIRSRRRNENTEARTEMAMRALADLFGGE